MQSALRRLLPLLAAALLLTLAPARAPAQPITITAMPIERLDASGAVRFGPLEFRGGLVLSSTSSTFGGVSGLVLDAKGEEFLAVTDKGWWLSGRIASEGDRPVGIRNARMAPMMADNGKALSEQGRGDVESLVRVPSGVLVGIEGAQEVWLFPGPEPLRAFGAKLISDPALARLGGNQGPETLLAPPGGVPAAVIVIAEESPDDPAALPGFLFGPLGKPKPLGRFTVARSDEFAATDAALADDGTVYLLERRFDYLRGVALRLRRFPLSAITPGAVITGEVLLTANRLAAIDNMEGLALHRNAAGELILTLISDDNFSPLQRTLLLRFALVE
ncbi:esterase-like activity of phytase family protein [Ancylobacter sp. FA202]|uniref:esterase-like activity of phytase family protein n=1 Tax=Ancylobacter sp. FA202 TaxID=1111106 RepID=UPI000379BAB8|nr:esterase-like activity of phytase family protein [Ancylobacter sp. FA202]